MQIFGDMLREGDTSTSEARRNGPKNMLENLPDTFSELQLEALRTQLGKSLDGTRDQLYHWTVRGFITYNEQTALYTKTDSYLKGGKM